MEDIFYLYDYKETTNTRFVSFVGDSQRFDLAIISSDRFFGKQLVLDMQSNTFAILGSDDLEEEGYLESAYSLTAQQAEELRGFLEQII
ncbi:DUF3055 domain-containing protein [Bacillus testis]|uniref:DUF3055 domain-containing protein n=1 Tax=Bacillus testis TaxID=1622072 RepID=UPI00067EDF2F|nr:DUF3055 domain-containing protein [Bacillus testis]